MTLYSYERTIERSTVVMNDANIIALLFDRKEQAIAELSETYGEYCFRIAYNILSNKQDSEECVNETWFNTWRSIPPKRPQSLKLFLSNIVRNLSFDKYRSKNRQKRGGAAIDTALDEIGEIIADTKTVDDEISYKELVQSINTFLRGLQERERNIFLRKYYYVETNQCIAERYSISVKNVNTILSRTRQRLKAHLEKEGFWL